MSPSVLFANSALISKYKLKFDEGYARRMYAAATTADAVKVLLPLGYQIEHEDRIVEKKLAETISTFIELCPDEKLKNFVLASIDGKEYKNKLNLPQKSLQYIQDYFGKGVTALPPAVSSTAFDLEMFLNWFIITLEEIREVKAILIARKLGIQREQMRTMLRGGK